MEERTPRPTARELSMLQTSLKEYEEVPSLAGYAGPSWARTRVLMRVRFGSRWGGGVPGAIGGGIVGGILGVAGGIISSGLTEPLWRLNYDRSTHNPALNRIAIDCDAEARTAVNTAILRGTP